MSPAERRRRARRVALLLSAILIPTAAVMLLMVRVVRQETELSERSAHEQRREALDQLRRELSARLQALRLAEVNRLIGESGNRLPPDSPIVFVAPMAQDHMELPWQDRPPIAAPSPAFAAAQQSGEAFEFRKADAASAAAAYRRSLAVAQSRGEQCAARVALGRAFVKAGKVEDAGTTDRDALHACGDVLDADGVPLALYAAGRLLEWNGADPVAIDYLVHRARAPRWRSPNEILLLQTLLRRTTGTVAAEPLRALSSELHDVAQITSLVQDMHDHLGRLQRAARTAPGDLAWMGYGDEPWLLTLVSPTSFATPVVMAVSSRRIVPDGVTLLATPNAKAAPLGDGFVDLSVVWPDDRFLPQPAVPVLLYASMLCVVLGSAFVAGYLLLRDVHREAETAAMRSHFVASVSHELKTPLTSIRAHAETLLLGRADGAQTTTDYLRTIVSESERLTRLVDSVLEFSRVEQGRRSYHLQETRLDDVVAAAAKTMEYPLAQFGFTLTVTSDGSAPMVHADPEALTQAILNLLGNAMKYSGAARDIEMRTGTRDGEAFVDVIDHGIGIEPGEQARIFERFHRVRSVDTAGIAGTGLGLPLALHVVEAHRGRIAVISDPGQGSTFTVHIPLQVQA